MCADGHTLVERASAMPDPCLPGEGPPPCHPLRDRAEVRYKQVAAPIESVRLHTAHGVIEVGISDAGRFYVETYVKTGREMKMVQGDRFERDTLFDFADGLRRLADQ